MASPSPTTGSSSTTTDPPTSSRLTLNQLLETLKPSKKRRGPPKKHRHRLEQDRPNPTKDHLTIHDHHRLFMEEMCLWTEEMRLKIEAPQLRVKKLWLEVQREKIRDTDLRFDIQRLRLDCEILWLRNKRLGLRIEREMCIHGFGDEEMPQQKGKCCWCEGCQDDTKGSGVVSTRGEAKDKDKKSGGDDVGGINLNSARENGRDDAQVKKSKQDGDANNLQGGNESMGSTSLKSAAVDEPDGLPASKDKQDKRNKLVVQGVINNNNNNTTSCTSPKKSVPETRHLENKDDKKDEHWLRFVEAMLPELKPMVPKLEPFSWPRALHAVDSEDWKDSTSSLKESVFETQRSENHKDNALLESVSDLSFRKHKPITLKSILNWRPDAAGSSEDTTEGRGHASITVGRVPRKEWKYVGRKVMEDGTLGVGIGWKSGMGMARQVLTLRVGSVV